MKNQALFSLKDKSRKLKCRLLQFLFGPLRVKQCSFEQTLAMHLLCFLYCKSNIWRSYLATIFGSF